MKKKDLWFAAVAILVAGSGCTSAVRPCMTIPAQIELAESKRDQAKEAYDAKMEEVTRSLNNLDVSRGRLERLVEERDELKALLGEEG